MDKTCLSIKTCRQEVFLEASSSLRGAFLHFKEASQLNQSEVEVSKQIESRLARVKASMLTDSLH